MKLFRLGLIGTIGLILGLSLVGEMEVSAWSDGYVSFQRDSGRPQQTCHLPERFCQCNCQESHELPDLLDEDDGITEVYSSFTQWWNDGGQQMCQELNNQICTGDSYQGRFYCFSAYYCPDVR